MSMTLSHPTAQIPSPAAPEPHGPLGHRALECELIRRTDALVAAVGAHRDHEPALEELTTFLHDEVLAHVRAEERLLGVSSDSSTALLTRAVVAQHSRLVELLADVDGARTGVEAVRAASAVVALFMAVAEAEDSVLLPALAGRGAGTPTTDRASATETVGTEAVGTETVATGAATPVGTDVPRHLTLSLCGRDYTTCRRELGDAVRSLRPGDTLTITSGPELRALRFELEATLPARYRWTLPAGPAECATTTVERV